MSIYDSKLWIDDINAAIGILPELDDLAGHGILITGASGLICSAIIDILIMYNENHDEKIIIYAAGRDKKKIELRYGAYVEKKYFRFMLFDSCSNNNQ